MSRPCRTCTVPGGLAVWTCTVILLWTAARPLPGQGDCTELVDVDVGDDEVLFQDANGNGQLDIGDPVLLLNFLFLGGPPPLELCSIDICRRELSECRAMIEKCLLCGCEASSRLPATGQKSCFEGTQAESCEVAAAGQDGHYRAGCDLDPRFVIDPDGTVTDRCTGLMWMERIADIDRNGLDANDAVTWTIALTYCERLVLTLGNQWDLEQDVPRDQVKFDDWRLPNINELMSLLNWGGNIDDPDPEFRYALTYPEFKHPPAPAPQTWFWTSTTWLPAPRAAWVVRFLKVDGAVSDYPLSWANKQPDRHLIRAVRTACVPPVNEPPGG